MDMQESVVASNPAPKGGSFAARLTAGIIIILLAGVLIIALVPGWRASVLDFFLESPQEMLLKEVAATEARLSGQERLSEEELLGEMDGLRVAPLSEEEVAALLDEIQ